VFGPNPHGSIDENWYSSYFPGGQFVYPDTIALWRTADVILKEGHLSIPGRTRLLVESVYGKEKTIGPEPLKKASYKAKSEKNKQVAIAKQNTFPLDGGFIRPSDTEPWPDTQSPTRLSMDTETYRLCIIENNRLIPLSKDENHPWDMSEVKYRPLEINYDTEMINLIEKTNRSIYDRGRGGRLMPVVKTKSHDQFQFESLCNVNTNKKVIYDKKNGLRLET
jgi:hypothetical protein